MKRSKGVTAVGVLVLVGGVVGVLSNAFMLATGSASARQLELRAQELEMQREALQQGPLGVEVPAARKAQLVEQLDQAIALTRELGQAVGQFYRRASVRNSMLAGLLLGLAGCASGLGVLGLKSWGRLLLMGQAAVSIPLGGWAVSVGSSSSRDLASAVARASAAMSGASAQAPAMQEALQQVQTAGLGIGIVLLVAWNAFVIWFMLRGPVRAQFAPQAKA